MTADGPLPRAAICRVFGTRQRFLCRVYLCAESPALGKRGRYREQDFAECPTKSPRQSAEHSAKSRIPVVIDDEILNVNVKYAYVCDVYVICIRICSEF
jgi:hypothetical protein